MNKHDLDVHLISHARVCLVLEQQPHYSLVTVLGSRDEGSRFLLLGKPQAKKSHHLIIIITRQSVLRQ